MLVLSRKKEEDILIGKNIIIKVVAIKGESVKIGITAPPETVILRKELLEEEAKGQGKERNRRDGSNRPRMHGDSKKTNPEGSKRNNKRRPTRTQ